MHYDYHLKTPLSCLLHRSKINTSYKVSAQLKGLSTRRDVSSDQISIYVLPNCLRSKLETVISF